MTKRTINVKKSKPFKNQYGKTIVRKSHKRNIKKIEKNTYNITPISHQLNKEKAPEFSSIRIEDYPDAKKFNDGSKPIECDYVSDGINDSQGYGVFIDGRIIDIFYGQGNDNWNKEIKFRSADHARKWFNKNLDEPITNQKLKDLGFKRYFQG